MTWHDWIGNFSYLLLAFSYLVTNMLRLRVLAMLALGFEALYLYFGADKPLWVGIAWSAVFVAINGWQVLLLVRDRLRARLTDQERALRLRLCPGLDDVDFHRLVKISLPVRYDGEASVLVGGEPVRRLKAGSLIGEVSFFGDDLASASVVAERDLSAWALPKGALRELVAKHETINNALNQTLGKTLAARLVERTPAQQAGGSGA